MADESSSSLIHSFRPISIAREEDPNFYRNLRRQRSRVYHRVASLLDFWFSRGYVVLWICLTSAPSSPAEKLCYNHRRLKAKISRKYGFGIVEHLAIKTNEGYGVLHLFWACKVKNGRRFYVPVRELSKMWEELHGAKIVWVRRIRKKSSGRLASYCCSQYCSNQNQLERMSWSWRYGLGGALVKTWQKLKRVLRRHYPIPFGFYCGLPPYRRALLSYWRILLRGGSFVIDGVWFIGRPLGFYDLGPPRL